MRFLEELAISFFQGLTGIIDDAHQKIINRSTKKKRDKGGQLKPGLNKVLNSTHTSEPVLDKDQWHVITDFDK